MQPTIALCGEGVGRVVFSTSEHLTAAFGSQTEVSACKIMHNHKSSEKLTPAAEELCSRAFGIGASIPLGSLADQYQEPAR